MEANNADTTTHFHGAIISTTPTGTRLILRCNTAPFTLSSGMTVSASASCAFAMSQRARPTKPRNSPVCDDKSRVRWDHELWGEGGRTRVLLRGPAHLGGELAGEDALGYV